MNDKKIEDTIALSILQLDAFINLWLCKTRIEIEQLTKNSETMRKHMLESQLFSPLEAWYEIKKLVEEYSQMRIEAKDNLRKLGSGRLTLNDVPPPQEANMI